MHLDLLAKPPSVCYVFVLFNAVLGSTASFARLDERLRDASEDILQLPKGKFEEMVY